MQHPLVLLAVGCLLGGLSVVSLELAVTWSSSRTWSVASGILGVHASALTWSSTASRSSKTPLDWDVPSADIAASAHPLRSVGERSADNAVAHHARLASEIKAADKKQVRRRGRMQGADGLQPVRAVAISSEQVARAQQIAIISVHDASARERASDRRGGQPRADFRRRLCAC